MDSGTDYNSLWLYRSAVHLLISDAENHFPHPLLFFICRVSGNQSLSGIQPVEWIFVSIWNYLVKLIAKRGENARLTQTGVLGPPVWVCRIFNATYEFGPALSAHQWALVIPCEQILKLHRLYAAKARSLPLQTPLQTRICNALQTFWACPLFVNE